MADAAVDDTNDPFKRRRRAKRVHRKRQRCHEPGPDEECDAAPKSKRHVPSGATEDETELVSARDARAWQREEFTDDAPVAKPDATAERRDKGGETSGGATASSRPFGPLSAPSHLRTSVRVDYQPDVCKDYKETGYCGFGDSCKFLHDRSDYKAGWQLDRDWADAQRIRRERAARGEDPDKEQEEPKADVDDDGLPFACFICRGPFVTPVQTLCAHYFCEDCALTRMTKHSTCAVCGTQLGGTLNIAHKLAARIKKAKK